MKKERNQEESVEKGRTEQKQHRIKVKEENKETDPDQLRDAFRKNLGCGG